MSIYDFTVKTQDGREVSMAEYKGKVLLIVNTATACGFTPQYEPMQKLYDAYHKDGLQILDFPCNQFGAQAPGSDAEIHSFCSGRFGITFPQFSKVDVNGENATPLYQWLAENSTFGGFEDNQMGQFMAQMLEKMDPDYKNKSTIKWNFTKFLIDREGNIAARFEPTADMEDVKKKIEEILK